MPQKLYLINDPAFVEYCFHCMSTAKREQLAELSEVELRAFKTRRAMRTFAENQSTERRLLLLAKLGISFSITMAPPDADVAAILAGVDEQFKVAGTRADVVSQMSKGKMFVWSSRAMLHSLHMASQNSQLQLYVLDYGFLELKKRLDERGTGHVSDSIGESIEAAAVLSKLVLASFASQKRQQTLTQRQMEVLLALLPDRNTFVSLTTIATRLGETARSQGLANICARMASDGYLQRMSGYRGKHPRQDYTIAERGINAVMMYLKGIAKAAG